MDYRIGVTIPVYASTRVSLDGDGGVVVDFDSSLHIFRPVSVQAMWTMFQRLHKVCFTYFLNFINSLMNPSNCFWNCYRSNILDGVDVELGAVMLCYATLFCRN